MASRSLLRGFSGGQLAALNRARQLSVSASSRDADASPMDSQDTQSYMPKIVVFGGRGFVGSHICQEALGTGLHVVGISKSGTPPISGAAWTKDVEWVRGNLLEPQTYQQHLQGAVAAISSVGLIGANNDMLKINGTANVIAAETCKAAGVPRFVYISATIPKLPGLDMLLSGYINGKAEAEAAVQRVYPDTGVILRPGVVYGNRVVSSSLTLPLGAVFQPLEMALAHAPKTLVDLPVVGGLFVPPVSASAVAKAAVQAATDGSVAAGILGVPEIQQYK